MQKEPDKIRVAFGSVPKDGGTFTFYRNMRPALKRYGVELFCVTVGRREAGLVEPAYVDDGCVMLAAKERSIKEQALAFADWCEREDIDVVIATNSVAMLSALPFLPESVRVVSRCASGRDEGYRITMSGRERLMKIIALTPRLRDELVKKYGANPDMVELIPNGVDPEDFMRLGKYGENGRANDPNSHLSTVNHQPAQNQQLQLGFLGRLHKDKGVFHLSAILACLKSKGVDFCVRIAGKGVHRKSLEEELHQFIASGEVEFVGALTKDEVPAFLGSLDVYLFTSHFEGCPNSLLEAMMAGAVPVAFLIEGITDFIIRDGETGFVVPMADCKTFAGQIKRLADDRALLRRMSEAVMDDARARFVPEVAAREYARVFREVMAAPLPDYEPHPWSEFQVDPVYRRDWSLKHIVAALVRRMRWR